MLRGFLALGGLAVALSSCSGGGQTLTPPTAANAPVSPLNLSRVAENSILAPPTIYTKPHVLTLSSGQTANPTFVIKAGDSYTGPGVVCDRGAQSAGIQIDNNSTRVFNGFWYLTSTLAGQVTGVQNPSGTYHCHETFIALKPDTIQDGSPWGFYFDIVYPSNA